MTFKEHLIESIGEKEAELLLSSLDKKSKKLLLSVKSVLRESEEQGKRNKMNSIAVGTVFEVTVERMEQYGAFILLENGLTGLLHISQICEKRINKPSEMLKMDQKVKVKVLKVEDGKISLTMKDVDEKTQDQAGAESQGNEEELNSYSEEMTNTPFASLFSKLGL